MTTIYVGNLPFSATEADVRGLFEKHGAVQSVKLVNDRETGRPRGFGFVEMSPSDAQTAIQHMTCNIQDLLPKFESAAARSVPRRIKRT